MAVVQESPPAPAIEVAERRDYAHASFSAMGTTCSLCFAAPSHAEAEGFKRQVTAWLAEFEQTFSRFIPGSLVSRINASGTDWVDLPPEAESLVSLCDWFYWSTRGAFDPAILPLADLWDYHAPSPVVPSDAAVADALARCGWKRVERQKGRMRFTVPGMGIDLGGIGKEYAVDRVFEMGRARGLRDLLVDFGRDLRVGGQPPEGGPWRVGLENPTEPGRCWSGVGVTESAVTTSGDYCRSFKSTDGRVMGHIIDPRTGYPVANGCRAVSVIAQTCTQAGILSTSAFILGRDAGLDLIEGHFGTAGCIWHEGRVYGSRRFHEYVLES